MGVAAAGRVVDEAVCHTLGLLVPMTPGRSRGRGLPVAACGLVWFGLKQLEHFQTQERVWVRAVHRAELLALLNLALSPFTWWWSRSPDVALFGASVLLLLFSSSNKSMMT